MFFPDIAQKFQEKQICYLFAFSKSSKRARLIFERFSIKDFIVLCVTHMQRKLKEKRKFEN